MKSLYIKDERERFNLGSFKATGATFAIAKMAYNFLDNKKAPHSYEAFLDYTLFKLFNQHQFY